MGPHIEQPPQTTDAEVEELISIKPGRDDIQVTPPYDPEAHRQKVTLRLIVLLAIIIIGHYACLFVLDWNGKKVDNISNAFNAALPVISGLTGSAVTYYFTRK